MFNRQDPLEYKSITTLTHNDGSSSFLTFRETVRLRTEIDEAVKQKIIYFWEKRRIRFADRSEKILWGKRGSIWWNMVTFDMSKLKSDLTIIIDPKKRCVECVLEVNTKFQHITPMNAAYFAEEMSAFSSYLRNNDEKLQEWKDFKKKYRKSNLMWVLGVLLMASILGILSGLLEGLFALLRGIN